MQKLSCLKSASAMKPNITGSDLKPTVTFIEEAGFDWQKFPEQSNQEKID